MKERLVKALAGAIAAVLVTGFLAIPATAGEVPIEWEKVDREALELFRQYLSIDTTNPPGNEIEGAKFFAEICRRESIEHKVFEPWPGRGTIWARIKGDGSARPVILLNHLDVVPHSKEFWSTEAFKGEIRDGFVFGRGAMDMKSLGMAQFMVLLTLKRSGVRLKRDVIFLATSDEEAGGLLGAGWFAKTHPDLLGNAEFLFNEGGSNVVDGQGRVFGIGVGPSEKTPAWLRLTATGEPGHGSIPRPQSAVNRLLRALNRLLDYVPPVQLTPVVEQSFKAYAAILPPDQAARYTNLRDKLRDPEFLKSLDLDPGVRALIRNTISVTVLEGSNKINVIPPKAVAEIDTRLVPGESLDRWINELRKVIADDSIRIEPILAFAANASPTDTALVRSVRHVARKRFPDSEITHPVLTGFTDSHYFRELGIHCYGFSPFVASPRELGDGFHGNDERIGVRPFLDGVRFLYEVVDHLSN